MKRREEGGTRGSEDGGGGGDQIHNGARDSKISDKMNRENEMKLIGEYGCDTVSIGISPTPK